MSKSRAALTLDDAVWKALRIRAARTGEHESEFVERLLRRELGLDLLDQIWAKATMEDEEAMQLACDIQAQAKAEMEH
jgi:plasmid stability protein